MSSTKSLHELAQQGNIEALKTELSMCPGDVNNRNSRIKINGSNVFCTPLHAAVLGNQLGTCKFLIDEFQADAFLSTTEYNKHLPIHVAAINGFTEIVTMLIDYIMPVDVLNSYRETPLWLALQNERIETARALLQLGADPCHVGGPSNVPLINNICEMDKLKSLTFLVEECKVPINVVDSSGSTPLHKACQFGKDEMASYLVPNLTVDDINIVNVKGDTPLHTLCDRYGAGSEKIAQIILSASPNIVSMRNQKNGWTPLHYACSKQKIGLCTILLQHGADISILNNDGVTPLSLCKDDVYIKLKELLTEEQRASLPVNLSELLKKDDIEGISAELDKNIDRVEERYGTSTLLLLAVQSNKISLCKTLIEKHSANIYAAITEYNYHTPLHLAAKLGYTALVQLLIEKDIYIDILNSYRETPLWLALESNHVNTAQVLIDHQADPNHVGGPSNIPLVNNVCEKGNLEALKFLVEICGVIVDVKDQYGNSPLHRACQYNQFAIVQYLVEYCHANVNIANGNGDTPLHYCCSNSYADVSTCQIVNVIIKGGVTIGNINLKRQNELHLATLSSKIETSKLLLNHGADLYAVDSEGRTSLDNIGNVSRSILIETFQKAKYIRTIQKNVRGCMVKKKYFKSLSSIIRLQYWYRKHKKLKTKKCSKKIIGNFIISKYRRKCFKRYYNDKLFQNATKPLSSVTMLELKYLISRYEDLAKYSDMLYSNNVSGKILSLCDDVDDILELGIKPRPFAKAFLAHVMTWIANGVYLKDVLPISEYSSHTVLPPPPANMPPVIHPPPIVTNVIQTDVFLTHDWGIDQFNRENHKRVSMVNRHLRQRGINTWFDEEKLSGNIIDQMLHGIHSTKLMVVFITARYIAKVGGSEGRDNCKIEFTYGHQQLGPQRMIPVVMEPRVRDPKTWVGACGLLSGLLYVDMADDDITAKCDELSDKIFAALRSII